MPKGQNTPLYARGKPAIGAGLVVAALSAG